MIALLTDIYVVYHAKNLKISDDSDDENTKQDQNEIEKTQNDEEDQRNTKKKLCKDSLSLPGDAQNERFLKSPIKKTSTSGSHHTRHASRDLNNKRLPSKGFTTEDLRKSSLHIAGPMTDF